MHLQEEGLLEQQEYFVVGLWDGAWDQADPAKYLRGFLEDRVGYSFYLPFNPSTVMYCTELYWKGLHWNELHCTALYCNLLHCTGRQGVDCNTVLECTLPQFT